ncbi:MAG: prolyl oligopeptidase family serine peptidase [Gemmatimonadota bacterium]
MPRFRLLLVLLSLAVPSVLWGQAQRNFTAEDALNVKSASVADATDDARWLAVTVSTSRGRMGTDHFRYGDPTYIGPSLAEVMVLDSETGESQPIFDGLVQVQGLSWSPDGDRLAFRRYVDGEVRLEIWDRASGRVEQVRLRPQRELAWGGTLTWYPDGEGLLVSLRTPTWGQEARAAFLAMDQGPIVVQDSSEPFLSWEAVRNRGSLMELGRVEVDSGDVSVLLPEGSYTDLRIAEDGSHLTYSTATPLRTAYERGEGTEYAYFKLELEEGAEPMEVMEKGERRTRLSWAPDGSGFVYARQGDIFFKAPDADSAQNLTEEFRVPLTESDSTKRSFSLDRWHPEGDALLLRAQDGYYLMELDGEPELVWPFPGDSRKEWGEGPQLSVLQWTDDGRYLYASRAARDHWERGLVRYDLRRSQEEVLVSDSDVYRSWTFAEDGSRMVFRRSDGDRPEEIWTASGDFGDARALTDMNPWLDDVALAESQLIKYYDVDGEELYGIAYLPPDFQEGVQYPLVAEIYETFFDNGYSYSAQILAAQGWIVLKPSVDLEEGFPGEAWMKGVTTAINSLMDKGMVDGRQLGIHGTSYGGYATSLIITQTDRFAAAINISGKVNIISFLGDSEKITTRNYNAAEEGQDRIGATLWEQPQKYWAHSAVMYADRVTTPHLLLTGHGDWNVPDTNTREMYYALRRLGKEVVWVNYMRAGHGAGRAGVEEDYRDHWRRIIEWYDTHFKKAVEEDEEGG